MFAKVSALVPTRGRVARLRTMIASFDETTGNEPNAELVFRADEDDTETIDFLRAWGGHTVIVGPRLQGYCSMAAFFNEALVYASGDVLMLGNDDMVFRTPGWPAAILAAANRHSEGLFNLGVSTHNGGHYPFSVVSRWVAERMGFLWDPRVAWGDIFLRDVMSHFGRCERLADVVIDHDWAGRAPDATFLEGNAERFKPRGEEYWSGIHRQAVEEAIAKIVLAIKGQEVLA